MSTDVKHNRSAEAVDVAVVGGGPAGAQTAAAAVSEGARTVLLERTLHRPTRCAGLIGLLGRAALGVPDELIVARIQQATLHGPRGTVVTFAAAEPKGYVVDRARLDALLVDRAADAGVDVRVGVAATGWSPGILRTSSGILRPRVVVGADGPSSRVAHWAGLPGPMRMVVGFQATVVADVPPDTVEVFLGGALGRGSFGWSLPAGAGQLNVGLVTERGREGGALLQRFLAERFPNTEVLTRATGMIPLGMPSVCARDGVVLVGDAAGQVKPLSGGGLYYGALCARFAGEAAAGGPQELSGYDARCREAFGDEIAFGLRARALLETIEEDALERALESLRNPRLASFLAAESDIDRPSMLLRELRGRPSLWVTLLPLLGVLGGWEGLQELLCGLRSPPAKL